MSGVSRSTFRRLYNEMDACSRRAAFGFAAAFVFLEPVRRSSILCVPLASPPRLVGR